MEYMSAAVRALTKEGVRFPNPGSVTIGPEVNLDRISGEGVVIHPGCRIAGDKTLIMGGAEVGEEAPATVKDCRLGPDVKLKGGFYDGAVFLRGASMGYGAHVRSGTILEEEACGAHTVGLKQTILLPFVTLGSLINFCDILMAGGTSRKDHSEVGSSFIHFNYTPNQDKATPSLMGDVPRGVMLDRPPIFLGGQGGLVGPCRLAFGTVTAAGSITRKDEARPDRLIVAPGMRGGSFPFKAGAYGNIRRIVHHNLNYIANLTALMAWYRHVRGIFVGPDLSPELHEGLVETLSAAIGERIKRLKGLSDKVAGGLGQAAPASATAGSFTSQQEEFVGMWPRLEERLLEVSSREGDGEMRDAFLAALSADRDSRKAVTYLETIKALNENTKAAGTGWLDGVVEHVMGETLSLLPSFKGD